MGGIPTSTPLVPTKNAVPVNEENEVPPRTGQPTRKGLSTKTNNDSLERGSLQTQSNLASPPNQPTQGLNVNQQTGVSLRNQNKTTNTKGQKLVAQIKQGISQIPPAILKALDDPKFCKWLINNPEVLEKIANGDLEAVGQLVNQLPEGELKTTLQGIVALASLFPEKAEAALQKMLASSKNGLLQLAKALKDPKIKSILNLAVEAGLPLGSVLQDIQSGKVDSALLARLIDNKATAKDFASILKYLRDKCGDTLTINGNSPAFKTLMKSLNLPKEVNLDAIEKIQVGPGDKITLRFNDDIYNGGLISLGLGKELTLDLNSLENVGNVLTAKTPFGTAFKLVFTGFKLTLTGNSVIDTILDILAKILLFPILLGIAIAGEISGIEAQVETKDGETRLKLKGFGIEKDLGRISGKKQILKTLNLKLAKHNPTC